MRNLIRTSILTAGLFWLSISQAQSHAPICAIDDQGATGVYSEDLHVSEDLQVALQAYQEEIKQAGQKAQALRDQIMVLTDRQGQKINDLRLTFKNITAAQTALTAKTQKIISEIPKAYRTERQNVIDVMMKLNSILLQTDTYLQPYVGTLTSLQNRYSLLFTRDEMESIYPLGLDMPEGLVTKLVKNQKQEYLYRVQFSYEHVFRAQTRAAAQSYETRMNGRAYMETTRCALNRLIMGKLILNQALVGQQNYKIPVSANTKLCLNTTAGELLALTKQDAELRKENSLREVLSQNLPTSMMNFSPKTLEFLNETEFAQYLGQARVFPDKVKTLNMMRANNNLPEIPEKEAQTAIAELNTDIENQFKKYPDFQKLRYIWSQPELVERVLALLEDCSFNFSGLLKNGNELSSLQTALMKAEDFYFLNHLAFDIQSITARMSDMSPEQLQTTLRDYIMTRRRAATYEALIIVLGYGQTGNSANVELWLAAAQAQLQPLIDSIIDERMHEAQLDNFIQAKVQILTNQQVNARTMQLLYESFTKEMIVASKKIEPYLNPETDIDQLPYDQNAMIRTMNPTIARLGAQQVGALQTLIQEKNEVKRNELFAKFQNDIIKNLKSKNLSCALTGGFTDYVSQQVDRYVLDRNTSERTRATNTQLQNDCYNIQTIGLALNLSTTPGSYKNYGDVAKVLATRLDNGELKALTKNYRVALADPIMGEYRLLDQKLDTSTLFKEQKMYQLLAQQDPNNTAGVRGPILNSINKSIQNLNQILLVTAHARTPEDLNFLITRTKVINAILGENDLSTYIGTQNGIFATEVPIPALMQQAGFVFPNLIQFHKKIQEEMVNREDLHNEVWEEFINTNGTIVLAVFGGWAAKHVLGVLPRWVGGPALSGMIDKLGANTINLISGHGWFLLGLIATHIPTLEYKKYEYRSELSNINELTAAETLKPEGAENPIPLIEWDDYRNQYNLFKARIAAAWKAQAMDAFWLAFAGSQNLLIRKGTSHVARGTDKLNTRLENLSGGQRLVYTQWLKFRYRHKLALLSTNMRILKNPESVDVSTLLSSYNRLASQTTNLALKAKYERAYERIIVRLGGDLENVVKNAQLKELHAKVLFGPRGTAQQIDDLWNEYIRIIQKQNAAVGL